MLNINKLSKNIGPKKILNAVSLEVSPGQIAFLLGESGVGKSTLIRILNGLETYDSGSLKLNGQALNNTNIHTLVGMVFQHFNLFPHLTVERNITLALEKVQNKNAIEAKAIATALLKKYKLEDKAASPVSSLSGGQKQRLAIVRALALNPKIICLDEPTSALDPSLSSYVAQQIQELANEGRIVLVATHSMSLVLNDNLHGTVYLMKEGRIVEQASTEEIKKKPDQFKFISQFVKGATEPEIS